MSVRRSACIAVGLTIFMLSACGSDSGGAGGTGTKLSIDGAATTGFVVPDPDDPTSQAVDPDNAIEIDISGEIDCGEGGATGTGAYEATAPDLCAQIAAQSGLLESLTNEDPDELVCSQIFGGRQHASITGTVDGVPIDIDVDRKDGCGIDNWQQLEWLLGPPER